MATNKLKTMPLNNINHKLKTILAQLRSQIETVYGATKNLLKLG